MKWMAKFIYMCFDWWLNLHGTCYYIHENMLGARLLWNNGQLQTEMQLLVKEAIPDRCNMTRKCSEIDFEVVHL